jgi:ferric-dicitrate binding protein FerR (iron transport regulator)
MVRPSQLTWTTRALFLATALVLTMAPLSAQDSAARVIYQTGQVSLANGGYFKALSVGDPVKAQQVIVTGADGYARFEVSDGSTFEVFPNSKVIFRETPGNWQHLLNVWMGRVKVLIQHAPGVPNPNQVTSPTAVISVRGTVFDVVVEDAEGTTFVTVDEGEVAVRNVTAPGNSAILHAGDSIRVSPGVPLLARQIDKGNILRNALRYARDVYYNARIQRPGGGSGPVGTPPGSGGAQGSKGKGDGTTGPGAPPSAPGAPPAAPGAPPAAPGAPPAGPGGD